LLIPLVNHLLINSTTLFKNPSFLSKNIEKQEKALWHLPKGWKWSGSPDRTIFATFS